MLSARPVGESRYTGTAGRLKRPCDNAPSKCQEFAIGRCASRAPRRVPSVARPCYFRDIGQRCRVHERRWSWCTHTAKCPCVVCAEAAM